MAIPVALPRGKILVILSLALTWWFASLIPRYQPAIHQHFKARLDEARQRLPTIKVDWRPPQSPRDAFNASKVALLIEPRPLPHLVPQILHMISVVPPDWRFLFIGSEQSIVSVGRTSSIKYQQVIGKLDLMVLPDPWNITSKEYVDRTLTDPRFYDEFLPDVEWLLKYESDSILCANSQSSLDEWLDLDWVGAPRSFADSSSGGGGLTLRRVSIIRQVLSFQARYNDTEAEDEWFGKRVPLIPGAKISTARDRVLTVENVYVADAMGYHIPNGGEHLAHPVWGVRDQRKAIFGYCPEVTMLMEMKLERERCYDDPDSSQVWQPFDERRKMYFDRLKQKQEEDKKKAESSLGPGATEEVKVPLEITNWSLSGSKRAASSSP